MENPNVFLVAAEVHSRHIFNYMLKNSGFDVTVVGADELVARATGELPHLIIIDDADADLRLARELRESMIPVLVLADKDQVSDLLEAGASSVMEKPAHLSSLVRHVRSMLAVPRSSE